MPGRRARDNAGTPRAGRGGQPHPLRSTTHLTVADATGTVVAYTFTIESTGGNGIVVPGWGFLVNNELTDFDYGTPGVGQPAGRRQAAALVDRPDDRPARRRAGARGRLAGRLDDHHHGAADPARAASTSARRCPRRSPRRARRSATPPTTQAEPAFIASPEGQALAGAFGHVFAPPPLTPPTNGEIGAATGIEFLPHGGFLAAAEPTRRGGGSAQVVSP